MHENKFTVLCEYLNDQLKYSNKVHCPTDSKVLVEYTRILDIQCSVNLLIPSQTVAPTHGSYTVIVDLMATYYYTVWTVSVFVSGSKALMTMWLLPHGRNAISRFFTHIYTITGSKTLNG